MSQIHLELSCKSDNMLECFEKYSVHMKGNGQMKKVQKGNLGYLSYQKVMSAVITAVMFIVSISLYIAGYITTKSNQNLLTVVAILGCLPASKSAVSFIMYLKAKGCSQEDSEAIESVIGNLDGFYELYFTAYDKNFAINHLVVTRNSIIAYSADKKIEENDFSKHIKDILNKERISDITVKLFADRDKYLNRLNELNQSEADTSARNDIVNTLFSVSL